MRALTSFFVLVLVAYASASVLGGRFNTSRSTAIRCEKALVYPQFMQGFFNGATLFSSEDPFYLFSLSPLKLRSFLLSSAFLFDSFLILSRLSFLNLSP